VAHAPPNCWRGDRAADSAETLRIPADQNIYLWAISFVAALGGLLLANDWVVIGGAKPFKRKILHLNGLLRNKDGR